MVVRGRRQPTSWPSLRGRQPPAPLSSNLGRTAGCWLAYGRKGGWRLRAAPDDGRRSVVTPGRWPLSMAARLCHGPNCKLKAKLALTCGRLRRTAAFEYNSHITDHWSLESSRQSQASLNSQGRQVKPQGQQGAHLHGSPWPCGRSRSRNCQYNLTLSPGCCIMCTDATMQSINELTKSP